MDSRHLAIVVQGLFEKSDSIGYDAVFQFKLLREICGESRVRIFADRFDPDLYPDVPVEGIDQLRTCLEEVPSTTVIYHYCDGWPELDEMLVQSDRSFVLRWHNNTPPWFYGSDNRRSVERTVRGFRTIVQLIQNPGTQFWVNSNFTLRQLEVLGADRSRSSVVYPGSRYLEQPSPSARLNAHEANEVAVADRPLRLLFVSRVVAHKGHRHVLRLAGYLQRALHRDVSVTFIGRDDPASNLAHDLSELAASEDVELLIRGEVDEAALRSAYLATDLFACLSEHEGFGMPVFEAMRMGVPVICLGRAALSELMEHHPFTLDDLDFEKAARAVRLLEDQDAAKRVQEIQHAILASYTRPVVARQIRAALDGVTGEWSEPSHECADLLLARAELADDIDLYTVPLAPVSTGDPKDVGGNYFTLYDLQSYEGLLTGDRAIEHLPAQKAEQDTVLFSANEFLAPGAKRLDNSLIFNAGAPAERVHAIYGPYARFPRGYFAAEFDLEAERSGNESAEIEIDVAIEGMGAVATRILTAAQLSVEGTRKLLFPVTAENSFVEFRVRVTKAANCNFEFRGVRLRNMRQCLRSLPDTNESWNLSWLRRVRWLRPEQRRLSAKANEYFASGDRNRDKAWWNDAAADYARGVAIEPTAFAYHVQMGNCLKEAGRLQESEAAYHRALALRPANRDLHLQLGRLYRLMDKAEAANYHLMRAAHPDPAMREAMEELAQAGFEVSALPLPELQA